MCVSGVCSGAVSRECVCVSCEWASRRSSVVRREAFLFALVIPKFSCRVLNSRFRVVFWSRFSNSISRFLEVVFWSRISNSSFSFRCSIRLLESHFEFVVEFDFSNFVSNFKFEFVVEICRRNFRFVALFDFSNLTLNSSSNSTSRISLLYSISRISSFRFDFSIQVPWIWWFEIVVEFRIRLDLFDFSNFDLRFRFESFVALVKFSKSHSSFEFLIELFNFRRNSAICIALMHWRPQLFSHERSRFALVATRALRALFVRKILVKRQFTCSLYFGIIEL